MEENNITMEPMEPKVNPFEYVTINLAEYRKLVTTSARKKVKKEYKKLLADMRAEADRNWEWYRKEHREVEQLRKNLDDAKALIAEKLGVNPDEFLAKKADAETEKLADLQFEKGVTNA